MNNWGIGENIQSDVTFFLGKRGDSRRSSTKSCNSLDNGGHFENSNAFEADDTHIGLSTIAFCCRENLEDCLRYLSQELGNDSTTAVNLVQLANSVYDLLSRHRKSLKWQEELESRYRRTNCDLEHCQTTVAKLNEVLEQKERSLGSVVERERQLLENIKILQTAIKCEKEEVKRLNAIITQRDAQYLHDTRKSEREKTKLRERCQQLLADKSTGKRFPEIEILNLVQRSDGSRSKWKTPTAAKRNEDHIHQAIVKSLEDRCHLLVAENKSLRDNVARVYFALEDAVDCAKRWNLLLRDESSTDDDSKLSKDFFQLPCALILPNLEQSLEQKLKQLENFLQYISGCKPKDVQKSVASSDNQDGSTLPTCLHNASRDADILKEILEEKRVLAKQRQLFNEQRDSFYKERREFADAVIRLGSDDQSLQKKKAEFLKQDFVKSSTSYTDPGRVKSSTKFLSL